MERVRKRVQDMPLRRALVWAVALTIVLVLAAGGLTIGLGFAFMDWLLPKKESFFLNVDISCRNDTEIEYFVVMEPGDNLLNFAGAPDGREEMWGETDGEGLAESSFLLENDGYTEQLELSEIERMSISLDRFENGLQSLSPRRRAAYMGTAAAMMLLPFLYFAGGIVGCAFWFYHRKLEEPIRRLAEATEHIREQDLDFAVEGMSEDELGRLGASFERMRDALAYNNRRLWDMLTARKELQASVAHDLRNPIAIIRGYAEYLQLRLEEGALEREEEARIASNLESAACRLERYTDSLRTLGQLEELEICREDCDLSDILERMADDFALLARQAGIRLKRAVDCPGRRARLDTALLYRVVENLVQNSLRFAREEVRLSCAPEGEYLVITVADDGPGFGDDILRRQKGTLLLNGGEHMGMGLTVCQVLCRRQDWMLWFSNGPEGGAVAELRIFAGKSGVRNM